jgi:hypothetical protein
MLATANKANYPNKSQVNANSGTLKVNAPTVVVKA